MKKRQTEKDREKPQKTSILKGLFSLLTRTEMVNLILDGLYYSLDQRNKKKNSLCKFYLFLVTYNPKTMMISEVTRFYRK